MHNRDAKILPTVGVEEGRVVIHPHTKEAWVWCNDKWNVITGDEKDNKPMRKIKDEAYDRAMMGI